MTLSSIHGYLIAYGLHRMRQVTGVEFTGLPRPGELGWVEPFEALLGTGWPEAEPVLTSIFSRVHLPERGQEQQDTRQAPKVYIRPAELCMDGDTLFPKAEKPADLNAAKASVGQGFARAYADLEKALAPDDPRFFTAFYHLMERFAWALPNTYGEPGVSLFQQWKAVAALVFASGGTDHPADRFTLIGGDIPGIQDFVYTITSKGAAKGLRGRSFFLQLLGDAVVRRVLADLELCLCNVVYDAGGNFMVLGPEEEKAVKAVERIRRQVNARLVEAIQGETALVLEAMPVSPADLFTPHRFKEVRDDFAQKVAQAKNRPLKELTDDWATLFEPKGRGSALSCTVCRIEVDEHNSKPLERTGEVPEGDERPRICYLCDSFARLARDIRHENLWMTVAEKPERLGTEAQPKDGWAELLARMSGFDYQFNDEPPKTEGTVLALNRPDFLKAQAHGFRLLANVTPKTTQDDINYLRDEARWEEKDIPEKDDIRSFTLLAHAAATAGAIERVGVLRMDVDNLGRVFSEGVPDLTLLKLSALSGALDMFFGGYLNVLVRDQTENDLYIIYAGGDDLFIVGAWHHLPDLAGAIRKEFKVFTGELIQKKIKVLSGGERARLVLAGLLLQKHNVL
nr:type III-A CRISPR-associated protein Cas10/Csm1 [Anaerolineae bacterium]